MHNTIMTAKFGHGLVNEFRTIITTKVANFLSKLPLKYYQNIINSNTCFIFVA